ncbi:metallophosphoesterase [Lysobacter silvisoli]|uniref:Metallophosphoesterase n=1 Tax=Lysobacter silvisoli TaxID=2293254 RepID=A0A371K6K6_9GAMM|nr:metallophosphoesterase [Lysobacter silvisoli]RDZ29467.1 metallophosphoesterase [Lysobacter silvisoli]
MSEPSPPRRRRKRRWAASILAALVLAFAVWGCVIEPASLRERDYAFGLPNWPRDCDGLRVDLVSDLHVGSPRNGLDRFDRLVRRLADSDAQAVLMAGDYVILSVFLGTYIPADTVAEHLKPLTARKPVYAVLGNHDWWKDGARVRRALESAGVVVLEDEAREVRLGGCRLWMVGIGDLLEAPHDVGKAFSAINDQAPALAITHNPLVFRQTPARASLLVAGHTHGGQIAFPLLGRPGLWKGADGAYPVGHFVEDGRQLFVTPGIGTSILPIRFGVPPEISRLHLCGQGREAACR